MDAQPKMEVHCYFEDGGRKFEKLAADWRITDVEETLEQLRMYRERYGEIG
jgi:hypothetical protein